MKNVNCYLCGSESKKTIMENLTEDLFLAQKSGIEIVLLEKDWTVRKRNNLVSILKRPI
jgi:hypothetical protein